MNDPTNLKKRKRSAPPSTSTINPRSHTPNTLKQFKAAGLSVDAPLPSKVHPDFPHQPIPPPHRTTSKFAHYYSSDVETSDNAGYDSGTTSAFETEGEQSEDETPSRFRSMSRASSTATRGETPQHGDGTKSRKATRAAAHKKHVGGLLQVIERGLMEGEISTAKRAFGLLVRSRIYGDAVDLRYGDYWKLGVEILIREGEEEERKRRRRRKRRGNGRRGGYGVDEGDSEGVIDVSDGEDEGEVDEEEEEYKFARKRAGENLGRVRAYYETLIKLYPWNRSRPRDVSALDFYAALWRFEVEDVREEYEVGVGRLERLRRLGGGDEEEEDEEEEDDQMMDVDEYDGRSRKKHALRRIIDRPRDRVRQHALERMVDIASRMDEVLLNLPFSKDYALLSLRAEAAMRVGDLSIPEVVKEDDERSVSSSPEVVRVKYEHEAEERRSVEEGKLARVKERMRARRILKRLKKEVRKGGSLDKVDEEVYRILRSEVDDEDEDDKDGDVDDESEEEEGPRMFSSLPTEMLMYSSLPIRQLD